MKSLQHADSRADFWVLTVDDELAVRKLVHRFLTLGGYNCSTAASCSEARELLKKQHYDLVLADLLMPQEDGLQLIRYLKEHYPQTARVMLTGTSDPRMAKDIMDVGVYGYIVKPFSQDMLLISVENALRHHLLAMKMAAHSGELEAQAWSRKEKLETIMENISIGVMMISPQLTLLESNQQMRNWFPAESRQEGGCFHHHQGMLPEGLSCEPCPVDLALERGESSKGIRRFITRDGERDFQTITSPVRNQEGEVFAVLELLEDVTQRLFDEREAGKRQKLEAVGQLAAGIVHEINTPVQFVMDNFNFLEESFEDLVELVGTYEQLITGHLATGEEQQPSLSKALERAKEEADLDYLLEELPKTIEQSVDGMQRINSIVRAMKEFSHPGGDEKSLVDLNVLLENAVTISKNEWKYVAEVETSLSTSLPKVSGMASELNQVFLNLIVNAAHAIGSVTDQGSSGRGKIKIATENDAEVVKVFIEDTGGGIPESHREKIFESFFTTKGRGEGTGQGLAIARRVIEENHAGTINFESTMGVGTRFTIEIPYSQAD